MADARSVVLQELHLSRAKSCLALAEYAADLATPRIDFSYEILELRRRACLWLLAKGGAGPEASEALAREAPPGGVARERWSAVRPALLRDPFEDARIPREQALSDGAALLALAEDLLAVREEPAPARAASRHPRRTRAVLLASLAVVLLGAAIALISMRDRLRTNLAEGHPWTTSSTLARCDPAHEWCANTVTAIFFHTKEEESPWIEFDLGERRWVRRVEVQNRTDCCQERAVPLVVEVGDDEQAWEEVARTDEPFDRWTARFPARQARYVRLRVDRVSMLHLEGVAIR